MFPITWSTYVHWTLNVKQFAFEEKVGKNATNGLVEEAEVTLPKKPSPSNYMDTHVFLQILIVELKENNQYALQLI